MERAVEVCRFKILISFGETQYSNIFTDFPNTKSNFITYLKTVGYDSVVKMITDIHAANKQNLDVNAKAFIITLNLVVDEKYAIVMPNNVTEVKKTNIIDVRLLPQLKIRSESYSEPSQTYKMEFHEKMISSFQPLAVFAKNPS